MAILVVMTAVFIMLNIIHQGTGQTLKVSIPYKVIENDTTVTYECQFNHKVDCLWKINGTAINVRLLNYKYVNGNSMNTEDCSIMAYVPATRPNVKCTGVIEEISKKFISENSSVTLKCRVEEQVKCSWRKNGTPITINKRYEYMGGHEGIDVKDCSIIIHNVSSIDQTTWICYSRADKQIDEYALAAYNLQFKSSIAMATNGHNATTSSTDSNEFTSSIATTNSISIVYINVNPTTTSQMPDSVHDRILIYTLISILGIIVIVVALNQTRKFYFKSQRTTNLPGTDVVEIRAEVPQSCLQRNNGTDSDGYLIPRKNDEFEDNEYEEINDAAVKSYIKQSISIGNADHHEYFEPLSNETMVN